MKPPVVLILNYRTPDLVVDCLDSVAERVIVIDNASGDDSLARLRARGIAPRALDRNLGFGGGHNVVLRELLDDEDAVFLLNADARLAPGALAKMTATMADDARIGIVGGGIVDSAGRAVRIPREFPSLRGELGFHRWREEREVDWVPGSAMLLRTAMLREIGLFDERFFLYYEDVDLCRRARAHGWRCLWRADATVVHDRTGPERHPALFGESREKYFVKHHGVLYAAAIRGARRLRWRKEY